MLVSYASQYHENEHGQVSEHVGPWQLLRKITNVECADGKRRTFWSKNGVSDTSFSIPGHVSVKGKTVVGFAWVSDDLFKFTPDSGGKNGKLLPPWPKTEH